MKQIPIYIAMILLFFSLASCQHHQSNQQDISHDANSWLLTQATNPENISTQNKTMNTHIATFSGGCFWCTEAALQPLEWVSEAISWFAGGTEVNPSYEDVVRKKTSHREAVQVTYDPDVISYDDLLDAYWRHIDPTDDGGQFGDRGFSYSTAIFYHDAIQKELAEKSLEVLEQSGKFDAPIAVKIIPYTTFYPAEDSHQDYYQHSSIAYNLYKKWSGRAGFIEQNWSEEEKKIIAGKDPELLKKYIQPENQEAKQMLTDLQYRVTRKDGTERPFDNEYWDNKKQGIYVDILTGEPLFSSTHKYESGTGWPSFDRPINAHFIVEKEDRKLFTTRTEIRSKYGDNHIGHVFDDGPKETTGKRYCMNSAAMQFVPLEQMEKEGYGQYLDLFE